jgi:hypothetical protein
VIRKSEMPLACYMTSYLFLPIPSFSICKMGCIIPITQGSENYGLQVSWGTATPICVCFAHD